MKQTKALTLLVAVVMFFHTISCTKQTTEPQTRMAINNYAAFYDHAGVLQRKQLAAHWHEFLEGEYERMLSHVCRTDTICNFGNTYTVLTYVALPDTCVYSNTKY